MQPERANRREFKNDSGGNSGNLLALGLGAAVIGAVGYGVYSLFKGRPVQEQPQQYRYGQSRSRDGSVLLCSICLEDMDITKIKYLKCGHGFHNNCILEWFAKEEYEYTCPCCRRQHTPF